MKTRNGFVSNSSSSSFIVDREKSRSDEHDKLLESYGFRKTVTAYPDMLPCFGDKRAWKKEENTIKKLCNDEFPYNYGYEVTVNQDEVIGFLIENKIPFVASVHYDQEVWFYTPEDDNITIATNYGVLMSMHGELCNWEKLKGPVTYQKASEYLEEIKKYI